ncbi:hypothetical protein [Pseudonocardia sp. MH-G8]|uniref:hypothetical protein n=1 Tax=Pseudonocardia sp. MH-G8 TaxID=1854588 RepID=UPI00117BCCAC|nr:hypothetical protein [Pseudonocardia sp. MH-G8]
MGVDPERLTAVVRLVQISGAVLGALLIAGSLVLASVNGGFEWTSFNETRQGQTALTYPALGLVFGLIFLIGPFTLRLVIRTTAGEQLYLNGTELTIVSPGNRETSVFNLTRARAQVRLDAPTGSNTGRAEASGKAGGKAGADVGTLRPVLALFRDSDNREFIIELANLHTRQMRSDREILILEGAMRFAADPATQRAAAQLRTVARWTRLPVIHETWPDAIPTSPYDTMSAPTPRTRVASGVPAPEIEIVGPNPT